MKYQGFNLPIRKLITVVFCVVLVYPISSCVRSVSTTMVLTPKSETHAFPFANSRLKESFSPPGKPQKLTSTFFGMTILHLSPWNSADGSSVTPFPPFQISTLRLWNVASWLRVEPEKGAYDWTRIDTTLKTAELHGVKDFVYTFGSVPLWASKDPSARCDNVGGIGTCAPPDLDALSDFTKQLVQRYCGRIEYYETWNEPNTQASWNGTNSELLEIAKRISVITKDSGNCGCTGDICTPGGGSNPNKVLLPSISSLSKNSLSWLNTYLRTAPEAYPYADIAAFHGYGEANGENIASDVQAFRQVLADHGLAGVELWNTEADWGKEVPSVGPHEAAWLMRYHAAQAAAGVSRSIWYAYDDCNWGTLWPASSCESEETPIGELDSAGLAYGVIQSWFINSTVAGCQEFEDGLWACKLDMAQGNEAWMLWNKAGADIRLAIPSAAGLTTYRDWQNNVFPVTSELHITEYPLLLER